MILTAITMLTKLPDHKFCFRQLLLLFAKNVRVTLTKSFNHFEQFCQRWSYGEAYKDVLICQVSLSPLKPHNSEPVSLLTKLLLRCDEAFITTGGKLSRISSEFGNQYPSNCNANNVKIKRVWCKTTGHYSSWAVLQIKFWNLILLLNMHGSATYKESTTLTNSRSRYPTWISF